jgi:hypothetical protein
MEPIDQSGKRNSAENFSLLTKTALNIIRTALQVIT